MGASQRTHRVWKSSSILVWWTLWPRSVHTAEAAATGNEALMAVGDDVFTALAIDGQWSNLKTCFQIVIHRKVSNNLRSIGLTLEAIPRPPFCLSPQSDLAVICFKHQKSRHFPTLDADVFKPDGAFFRRSQTGQDFAPSPIQHYSCYSCISCFSWIRF